MTPKAITTQPQFDISTPEGLIAHAIDKNVAVETMEKLLAMRRELKAEKAKEEYDRSMAAFQAECPMIKKTKEVKTRSGIVAYRYAPIESIVDQVRVSLMNNGFSYSTNMQLLENGVKVSVKVTHEKGHSEVTEMTVPLGTKTEIMSQSQVVAAAQTFAKRYAFCNAFGILTGDEDNDGATLPQDKPTATNFRPVPQYQQQAVQKTYTEVAAKEEVPVVEAKTIHKITPAQKLQLLTLLGKKGKTVERLAAYVKKKYGITDYQYLTSQQLAEVMKVIDAAVTDDTVDPDEAEKGIEEMKKEGQNAKY